MGCDLDDKTSKSQPVSIGYAISHHKKITVPLLHFKPKVKLLSVKR